MEVRNLRNMTIAQTPLLGDENTPSIRLMVVLALKVLRPDIRLRSLPIPSQRHCTVALLLAIGAMPLRTPMQDNLSINPETGMVTGGETPREQRLCTDSAKCALKAGFLNLLKPTNNLELLFGCRSFALTCRAMKAMQKWLKTRTETSEHVK